MSRPGERHPFVRGYEERDELVTQNRRLSFFAARLWAEKFRLEIEDAAAECDLALIRAAQLWRSDGGKTFAGYAMRAMFNQLVNFSKRSGAAPPPAPWWATGSREPTRGNTIRSQ